MAEETGFEASLEKLETLVARLESGELPLEEALRRFEEGMQLSGRLSEKLENARRRVEQLGRAKDGTPVLQPFPDPAFPDNSAAEEEDHDTESTAKPAGRKAGRGKAGKRSEDSLF